MRIIALLVAFILALGFLCALHGQAVQGVMTVRLVERENTAPTNNVVFWHFKDIGVVCSADFDSQFGKIIRHFENKSVTVTIDLVEPRKELVGIKR